MGTLRSVVGVVGAIVPIVYCGGLLYYFIDTTGSVEEAKTNGLGPTLLGLGLVGLLLCIPLIIKLFRLVSGPRPPGSGSAGPDASSPDGGGFDADAVIARYLPQRSAEVSPRASVTPSAADGGRQASAPSFGRRTR